jgi:hypothetical protein
MCGCETLGILDKGKVLSEEDQEQNEEFWTPDREKKAKMRK